MCVSQRNNTGSCFSSSRWGDKLLEKFSGQTRASGPAECSLPAEPGPALRPFSKLLSISRTTGGSRVHSWSGHYLGQVPSQ